MSTTAGNDGVVKVGANAVAEITSWNIDETADVLEDTAMGDEWKSHKSGGIKSWSGNIEAHWDATDATGQEAMTIGSEVALMMYPGGDGSGNKELSGNAIIQSISISVPKDGLVSASFTVTGNGALNKSTVA